jgi:MFS superfamily sulfate permease-like transporter
MPASSRSPTDADLFVNRGGSLDRIVVMRYFDLVVAAEPVSSVDVTAADVISQLDDALHAAGVELCFAEMKDPVKDKLKRFGLFTRFGEQTFFATVGEAVSTYLEQYPVDWVDWEDRRARS